MSKIRSYDYENVESFYMEISLVFTIICKCYFYHVFITLLDSPRARRLMHTPIDLVRNRLQCFQTEYIYLHVQHESKTTT